MFIISTVVKAYFQHNRLAFNRKSSFDMELLEASIGNRAKESSICCNAIVLELLEFRVQLTKASL